MQLPPVDSHLRKWEFFYGIKRAKNDKFEAFFVDLCLIFTNFRIFAGVLNKKPKRK